ncbi:MAG: heavy-metal-associated domain-containing protein [Alphaproteobacteria bacterium]
MKHILIFALVLLLAAPAQAGHGGKHIFVTINGLVCDFCAVSMKKVFMKKDPVSVVDVDLTTKIVTIGLKDGKALADDEVTKGVTDAGYAVIGIKRD